MAPAAFPSAERNSSFDCPFFSLMTLFLFFFCEVFYIFIVILIGMVCRLFFFFLISSSPVGTWSVVKRITSKIIFQNCAHILCAPSVVFHN